LSRVKKLLVAGVLMLGVVGAAAPAFADPILHEEVTVDPDYLAPVPTPFDGSLLRFCLTIGAGNDPTCIRI
jgi:hypothetical protein